MDTIASQPWTPTDYDIRQTAIHAATTSGAKPADVVKTATEIYNFLTAGNASDATPKPATETAKPAKADAPAGAKPAQEPSSDKPAASTAETATATSPSEAATGFSEDGSELTKQHLIEAATKFVSAEGKSEADLVVVFAKYGANKLSEVKVSDYAAVIAELALPVSGAFD